MSGGLGAIGRAKPRRVADTTGRLTVLAAMAVLSGCASVPASLNPVTWWHDLQGGVIAQQRPAPPGASDPYPNLATVPERPAPLDPTTRQAINQGLVADRANAQYEATRTPLADPSSRTDSPLLFGRASAPPPLAAPSGFGPSASLTAASAAPAPAVTPPAPVPAAGGPALVPPPRGSTAQMGALPALPTAPPPPANLPGASRPPPTPAKPPATPPGAPPRVGSVSVAFAPGATMPAPEGIAALREIAVKRGTGGLVVVGYGEAASSDPGTQAGALTLARLRAQAVAKALIADGVPAGAVVTDAQAEGRGAAVRLVN